MSKKNIFLISSVILGLVFVVLVVYLLSIKSTETTPGGISVFKKFLPFGGDTVVVDDGKNTATSTPTEENPTGTENFNQILRKISSEPVAGAGTIDIKAGTIVRYIEKATGHIYEVELFSPKHVRISNTTIPLTYDALWGNKNNSLVARYLNSDDTQVESYYLTINNSSSTETTLKIVPLPKNIEDISSFGSNFFYLIQNTNSSSGYISDFTGKSRSIWSSDIKELTTQFVNSKIIALNTKPAQKIPGYLYFIDTVTGQSKKILGDISGLTTLSDPLGEKIILLSQDDSVRFMLYTLKTKVYADISPITFPEKCVWSKKNTNILYCAVPKDYISGNSLISWYKGLISYSDDIWKYDIKNNVSSIVGELSKTSSVDIDVIKPQLSDDEKYLIFINKKDNSLWSLDLLQ
jgi:hypothetical protein